MTFCIEGTDPGAKGAVAFIWPVEGWLLVEDLPVSNVTGTSRTFTYADATALADLLRLHDPIHGYVERVHSSPQMGVAGSFSFGDNFGTIKGVHGGLQIPLSFVQPETWKKNLKVPTDKKQATARARELFPACSAFFTRPDRAEAALICLYGLMHLGHALTKRVTPKP